MKRLLLLAAALIVYGSLYPFRFEWWRSAENPLDVMLRGWPATIDRFVLRDVALNVLLYIPLGFAAVLAAGRRSSRMAAAAAALLLGVGLSTTMEVAQVYVPGRVSSLLDVLTNSIGTAAGVGLGLALQHRLGTLRVDRRRGLGMSAALLLAVWGSCQLYPFFPALSHSKLRDSLLLLARSWPASPSEVWAVAAEWFAALLALRAATGRSRWWWPAGTLVVLACRLLIATRNVTANEFAGAMLAWALWAAIAEEWKLRVGAGLMASALVVRELAPFHFSAAAQPFTWIPFAGTFESERQSAVVIVARKAFDYGVMIWLLRKLGVAYVWGGLTVAAVLFGFELLQVYLPGRTPEITDAVLAFLMASALWMSDR